MFIIIISADINVTKQCFLVKVTFKWKPGFPPLIKDGLSTLILRRLLMLHSKRFFYFHPFFGFPLILPRSQLHLVCIIQCQWSDKHSHVSQRQDLKSAGVPKITRHAMFDCGIHYGLWEDSSTWRTQMTETHLQPAAKSYRCGGNV